MVQYGEISILLVPLVCALRLSEKKKTKNINSESKYNEKVTRPETTVPQN